MPPPFEDTVAGHIKLGAAWHGSWFFSGDSYGDQCNPVDKSTTCLGGKMSSCLCRSFFFFCLMAIAACTPLFIYVLVSQLRMPFTLSMCGSDGFRMVSTLDLVIRCPKRNPGKWNQGLKLAVQFLVVSF